MRPRFSLRTLLVATTAIAILCYVWVIRPTQNAKRFVQAINAENYSTADKLANRSSELTFTKWKEERWGFVSEAELVPWSLWQLLRGTREISMRIKYFQLDQNYDIQMHLAATSIGVNKADTVAGNSGSVIDTVTISR